VAWNENGAFRATNLGVDSFPAWAGEGGAQLVAGDFDGDGKDDLALSGGARWATVPVAFSNGNGTFRVTNHPVDSFSAWAHDPGAKLVAADFNDDGKDDLALVGGRAWLTVPVAFSNGDGTFRVTNEPVPSVPAWAQEGGVQAVAGDVNDDGYADIVLSGGRAWASVPVAFGNGAGGFTVTNHALPEFPAWAAVAHSLVAADVDADGKVDLVLTGGPRWNSVPVALSNGDGTFRVLNAAAGSFAAWAQEAGARGLAGEFDGEPGVDVALTGVAGWNTIPVALKH
jgi:hypothetical protein